MKILMVNTFIGSTSTGNLTYDIYKNNLAHGDECLIAYGRDDVKGCSDSYKIGSKTDIYLHCAWVRVTDLNGSLSIKATKKFISFIKDYKPDVIHLHNLHGYYLNLKLFFEFLGDSGTPVVWTLHDCWAYTGHCPYYTNIGCEKWKTGCFKCPKKTEHPASYILDNSKFNYKRKRELFHLPKKMVVTPVSNWLSNEVQQSFLGDCRIKTVYNGLDLDVFQPRSSDFRSINYLEKKKIILGVAGIWAPNKGLKDFAELSERLEDDYKIVLVGLTDEQIGELPKKILGLKRTSNAVELAEIYSTADVFVNPSREETFGMVTAEALACGTPAVVYNATASPEIVDEDTGVIVEVGDIDGLVQGINTALKLKNVQTACVDRAKKLFDKKKNQNLYREIYQELLTD